MSMRHLKQMKQALIRRMKAKGREVRNVHHTARPAGAKPFIVYSIECAPTVCHDRLLWVMYGSVLDMTGLKQLGQLPLVNLSM